MILLKTLELNVLARHLQKKRKNSQVFKLKIKRYIKNVGYSRTLHKTINSVPFRMLNVFQQKHDFQNAALSALAERKGKQVID